MSFMDYDPIGDITGQTQQQGQGLATVVDFSTQNHQLPLMQLMGQEYLLNRRNQLKTAREKEKQGEKNVRDFATMPIADAYATRIPHLQKKFEAMNLGFVDKWSGNPAFSTWMTKFSKGNSDYTPDELEIYRDAIKLRSDLNAVGRAEKNAKKQAEDYLKITNDPSKKAIVSPNLAKWMSGVDTYEIGKTWEGEGVHGLRDFDKDMTEVKKTMPLELIKRTTPQGGYLVTNEREGSDFRKFSAVAQNYADSAAYHTFADPTTGETVYTPTNLAEKSWKDADKHNKIVQDAVARVAQGYADGKLQADDKTRGLWLKGVQTDPNTGLTLQEQVMDKNVQNLLMKENPGMNQAFLDPEADPTRKADKFSFQTYVREYEPNTTQYLADMARNRLFFSKDKQSMVADPYAKMTYQHGLNIARDKASALRKQWGVPGVGEIGIHETEDGKKVAQHLTYAKEAIMPGKKQREQKTFSINSPGYVISAKKGIQSARDIFEEGQTHQGELLYFSEQPEDAEGKLIPAYKVASGEIKPERYRVYGTYALTDQKDLAAWIEQQKKLSATGDEKTKKTPQSHKVSANKAGQIQLDILNVDGKSIKSIAIPPEVYKQTYYEGLPETRAGDTYISAFSEGVFPSVVVSDVTKIKKLNSNQAANLAGGNKKLQEIYEKQYKPKKPKYLIPD